MRDAGYATALGMTMACASMIRRVSTVSSLIDDAMKKAVAEPESMHFIIAQDMLTAEVITDDIERELTGRVVENIELLDPDSMYRVMLKNGSAIYVVTEKMYRRLVGRKKSGVYDVRGEEFDTTGYGREVEDVQGGANWIPGGIVFLSTYPR